MTAPYRRPGDVPDFLELLRLDGRPMVVLGGGAGIGRQTVHALVQAGADVVCIDRESHLAKAVAQEAGCHALTADATSRDDLSQALDEAARLTGPLTGLVDIIGAAAIGPLSAVDDAGWQRQVDINLRHAFLATQLAAPSIAAAGGGSIAFVGSISGLRAVPDESLYGMLKAALHHLIATMGSELALARVRVNGVAPGWTKTPRLAGMLGPDKWRTIGAQIPRGSAAEPWEIAAPLLFLMSQMSSYVTGHVLVADGGLINSVPHPDVFARAAEPPAPPIGAPA